VVMRRFLLRRDCRYDEASSFGEVEEVDGCGDDVAILV